MVEPPVDPENNATRAVLSPLRETPAGRACRLWLCVRGLAYDGSFLTAGAAVRWLYVPTSQRFCILCLWLTCEGL